MRLVFLSLLLLTGCALQPVYSGGGKGVAGTLIGSVSVPAIPERAGFLVRQALLERLGAGNGAAYELQVRLDDDIAGFGVRGDDSISRERRTLRARWQLVEVATGAVLVDSMASADAGIDVVQSEYAVVAAESAALERLAEEVAGQITTQLALYAHQRSGQ